MHELLASIATPITPILADYIWIGGGTLGLIVVVVLLVMVLRR